MTTYNPWIEIVGGNAAYGDLQPGDLFRFPNSTAVWIKLPSGWYWAVGASKLFGSRKFRTGAGTAVIKVERTEKQS